MKENIIEIIGFMMYPEHAECKATELIILFNQHLIDKAKESNTVSDLLEKTFIKL